MPPPGGASRQSWEKGVSWVGGLTWVSPLHAIWICIVRSNTKTGLVRNGTICQEVIASIARVRDD